MKGLKVVISFILAITYSFSSVTFTFAKEKTTVNKKTIESFELENLSNEVNEKGMYENLGTIKVDAITEIIEDEDSIYTKITKVEDFYNLNGDFKNSKLTVDEFQNDYTTGKAEHKLQTKKYKKPITITNLSREDKIKTLKGTESKLVENNFMKLLNDNTKVSKNIDKVKGITFEEMNRIKKISKELQDKEVIKIKNGNIIIDQNALNSVIEENSTQQLITTYGTVEAKGAFDNYYNHDISTGKFTAQALSKSAHKYVEIKGTTYNNSKNASTMVSFKSNINSYENYVIQKMEYAMWSEVAGWFGTLMGLVSMVVGYGTGPAGWVSIALYYGGAFATFTGLTSSVYATYSRLSLSKNAAQYCQNARNLLYYTNWNNVTMTVVNGF